MMTMPAPVATAPPLAPATALRQRFRQWEDWVREPALTVLLLLQLLTLFLVSPLASTGLLPHYAVEWLLLLLPLVALFALNRGSKARLLILVSLAPMGWITVFGSNVYLGVLLHMVVTLAITLAVAEAIFQVHRVTRHQLLGAVVVYLNLAILFMGVFAGIRFAFPQAFVTLTKAPLQPGELLYFSLTTITSTGYGDILPVHPLARSMANLEAVVGQLFLATFLARLVSLHLVAPRPPAPSDDPC